MTALQTFAHKKHLVDKHEKWPALKRFRATYSHNQLALKLVQSNNFFAEKFLQLFLSISNELILKGNFFAFRIGNLLEAAWNLGFPAVKRGLSTKLSTELVDSRKSAYETHI